jgi:hypothetical protein
LHVTYYPGKLQKKAVPFVMVHGWEGNRGEFDRVALDLQKRGHAALTIDLRGHGDSNRFKAKDDERKLDPARFTAADIDRMQLDLEAAKKFLIERNNAGELNIDALAIVAAKEGAIPALKWAVADWSAPNLPAYRQGQDVKAVFLLSPVLSFKGSTAQPLLTTRTLARDLSMFVLVGKKDPKGVADAKRVHTALSGPRKGTMGGATELDAQIKNEGESKKSGLDFFYDTDDTNLTGSKLFSTAGLKGYGWFLKFVKVRIIDREEDFAWAERRRPT